MIPEDMSAKDRRRGCAIFKLGLLVAFIPLFIFFGPKLGKKFGEVVASSFSKRHPGQGSKGKETDQPLTEKQAPGWDPAKEALPPGMAPAKPGKSGERTGSQPTGPRISAKDVEDWLKLPRSEWEPLLKARSSALSVEIQQELVALMREFQQWNGKGLGVDHPGYAGRRDSIVRRSASRFDHGESPAPSE